MRVSRVEAGEQRAEGRAQRPVGLGCSSEQKIHGEPRSGPGTGPSARVVSGALPGQTAVQTSS